MITSTGRLSAMLWRIALGWLVICVLLLLTNAAAIASWRFPDADDTLRLMQVRDLLAGQNWFDVAQHRADPLHGGVPMHWSRLVDLPIAGLILLLRPLLGNSGAELGAMVIVPLLTLGAALFLVGRVAYERLGREYTLLACLMLGMSVPVIAQIRPMRIDHHGWQIVSILLAMNGLMTRHARAGGWLSGVALALGMAISLEGLPLTVVFAAIGAWRWWRGGSERYWLAHFCQALLVASVLSFAATRGLSDLANHCDAVAPVHLAIMVWGALVLGVMAWRRVTSLPGVLIGFAVAGAGAGALYFGLAPQCAGGSFNELSPLVRAMWYNQIAEGLPIWEQEPTQALQIVLPALFALAAAWQLLRVSTGEERIWWQEYAALLAGALAVAIMVQRAAGALGALSAVPLAWQVARWLEWLRKGSVPVRLGAGLALILALLPLAPITIYHSLMPDPQEGTGVPTANVKPFSIAQGGLPIYTCDLRHSTEALRQAPQGNILASLDIGPELLMYTPDTVLATGHHRGAKPMDQVLSAFLGSDSRARAIVQANRIDYVAMCPTLAEPVNDKVIAPDGFAAHLLAGKTPGWLVPMTRAPGAKLMVWRVIH